MKKHLFLFIWMLLPMLASAQTVSDVQNSGCLNETRGDEPQRVPTIVLTKEGDVLSVQLLNYESNCCTEDFNVTSSINVGFYDEPCLAHISVDPIGGYCNCVCPFNVSFTVQDFKPNSFYLDCWWYKGQVELTESEPLVLKYNNPDPRESLYGEWRLVGWHDGGNWFEVNPKYVGYHHLSIEIPKEGYVMAYSMVNKIYLGLLTLNGNEMIFGGEMARLSTEVYCDSLENQFFEKHIYDIKSYQLEGNLLKLYYTDNDYFVFTSYIDDGEEPQNDNDYRPFVEEGKVWKVGNCQAIVDNSVQVVDYYYFDGDTIIGGKTCKQMMCQRFVSPGFSDEYGYWTPQPFLRKVGAWYEEDQKVYFYDEITQSMKIKYDFSLGDNETVDFLNVDGYPPYIIGPKQTGGIKGFKGVYRDIMMGQDINTNTPWLEGVGGLDGPFTNVYHPLADSTPDFLMSCVVGDEVIYYNDEYEDGATPAGARKNRFDFTHTPKIQPKTRISRGEEPLDLWSLATNGTQESVYGEYNDLQLGINLDPLDDAYLVSITNDSGKVVYEKTINAGNIVGLNIDISAYAKGRYTVTVENSRESFTGEFETLTTGISDAVRLNDKGKMINDKHIYNLQGQRLSRLQKGLNIVNGQKIYIK